MLKACAFLTGADSKMLSLFGCPFSTTGPFHDLLDWGRGVVSTRGKSSLAMALLWPGCLPTSRGCGSNLENWGRGVVSTQGQPCPSLRALCSHGREGVFQHREAKTLALGTGAGVSLAPKDSLVLPCGVPVASQR